MSQEACLAFAPAIIDGPRVPGSYLACPLVKPLVVHPEYNTSIWELNGTTTKLVTPLCQIDFLHLNDSKYFLNHVIILLSPHKKNGITYEV